MNKEIADDSIIVKIIQNSSYLKFKRLYKKKWGSIYLAIDFNKEIICVIKEISLEEITNINEFNKIKAEGMIIIDKNHENIVEIYEIIDKKSVVYISEEFINSYDLGFCFNYYKDKTKKRCFSHKIIQYIIKSLISVIQYLHNNNIIHRDIKLDNIILEFHNNINDLSQDFNTNLFLKELKNDFCLKKLKQNEEKLISYLAHLINRIDCKMNNILMLYENELALENLIEKSKLKLIDFGFSRTLDIDQSCSTLIGTHKYLPKKIYAYLNYGYEVDYYSIAILTFVLLTGKFPFEGESEKSIQENVMLGNYEIGKDCNVTAEIMTFITRLLNLNTYYINELEFLNKIPEEFDTLYLNETERFKTSYTYLFLKSYYEMPSKNNFIRNNSNITIVKIIDNYFID